jgi:hypothetical protein
MERNLIVLYSSWHKNVNFCLTKIEGHSIYLTRIYFIKGIYVHFFYHNLETYFLNFPPESLPENTTNENSEP